MATANSLPTYRRESIYLAVPLVPMLIVSAMFVAGGVREWTAARDVARELALLQSEGEPIGNASMTALYERRTSRADVAAWEDVGHAAEELSIRQGDLQKDIVWEKESNIAPQDMYLRSQALSDAFRRQERPLLKQVERLVQRNEELWQPIVFDGEESSYPIAGQSQVRDLALREFDASYWPRDTERGINALELSGKVMQSYGNDLVLQDVLPRVLSSLQNRYWSAEDDLKRIRQLVTQTDDGDQRWERLVSFERAEFLAEVDRVNRHLRNFWANRDPVFTAFGAAPSHVRDRLKYYKDVDDDLQEEVAFSLVSIPRATSDTLPLFSHGELKRFKHKYEVYRMSKRRVLTALAIKQFQLQEGRWPKSLDELTQVGLSPADWMIFGSAPFGYRVVEDGRAVLLWTGGFMSWEEQRWGDKHFQTPPPPRETILNESHIRELESTIR